MPPRLVLDAGALIAIERGDRRAHTLLFGAVSGGHQPVTHGGVLAQVWRGGARQALLAHALRSIEVVPLGRGLGRDAGRLLALTRGQDAIDAAVVCLAGDGDVIVTSDVGDIARLLDASGADARLVAI